MTQSTALGPERLQERIRGSVIIPSDPDYDLARKVWNATHDRRPAVIVQCADADDVATAIGYAVEAGLEIAVRGGAHSIPGASTCDDGLVIDLRRMNGVTVDPEARLVRVGGGALLADVDAATQEHGLAVPGGVVSHTGIGGLTLGGGVGWLTRLAGLTIDNLVSAQVVLADQRIVRAAEDENPDLFWALRGGGGNFGVVTEFEFRLHQVGPMVQFGMFFWPLEQQRDALRKMREVSLPRSVNTSVLAITSAPPEPFVPAEHHFAPGCAVVVAGFGVQDEFEDVVRQVRAGLPPLFEVVTPMPFVALQQLSDEAAAWGFHDYEKGAYFPELTDGMIAVLGEYAPRRSSPLSFVAFSRLDEAYCEVSDDATAFAGGRTPRYLAFITGVCPAPEMFPAERAWIRSLWEALKPYAMGDEAYVNSIDAKGEGLVRNIYGAKYARLAAIKQVYDPHNVFHRNPNILPQKDTVG